MTYEEIKDNECYKFHHRATRRGYVSRRKRPQVEEYSGRFGVGYIVRLPRYDTTQYHTVQYYIKEGK